MTQKELLLLLSYLYNNENSLTEEKRQLQGNVRYREIHDIDCMELLIASVRLETFEQVSRNIRMLLNISEEDYDTVIEFLNEKKAGE